jgi:nucleotidyltransferase substrate binding protein (TIGR01987 family)
MTLDTTPFHNAISRLREGLARYESDITDEQIRDGLIQRVECTYELSHKMLKRYLQMISPNPDAFSTMAFSDLIRTGNEQALLRGEWKNWKTYREMRSKTNHTYDENIALEVVAVIPAFLEEATYLYEQIKRKLA